MWTPTKTRRSITTHSPLHRFSPILWAALINLGLRHKKIKRMVSALTPFLGFLRGRLPVGGLSAGFSSLAGGVIGGGNNGLLTTPRGGLLGTTEWVRSIVHINFPRPKETKRIRVHGWNTRMKTRGGRAIIMRRILKGRFILSH